MVSAVPLIRIPPRTLPETLRCLPKISRSRPRRPSSDKFSTKIVILPPTFAAGSKFTVSSTVNTFLPRCRPHTRQDHCQPRPAPDPPPQKHHTKSSQRNQCQYLQKCDHRLPSFPEGALKNQQPQQVRSAESRLFQLLLPGLDIARIKC